ncbi:hypothetical protein ACQJBY_067601 [Aegilops geniculata]
MLPATTFSQQHALDPSQSHPNAAAPSFFTANSASAAAGQRAIREITLPNGDVYSGTLSSSSSSHSQQQVPEGTGRYVWAAGSCCSDPPVPSTRAAGREARGTATAGRSGPPVPSTRATTPPASWTARGPTSSPAPAPPPPLHHHRRPITTRGSGSWTASTATASRRTPTGTHSRAPGCRATWRAMAAGTPGPTATPMSAP